MRDGVAGIDAVRIAPEGLPGRTKASPFVVTATELVVRPGSFQLSPFAPTVSVQLLNGDRTGIASTEASCMAPSDADSLLTMEVFANSASVDTITTMTSNQRAMRMPPPAPI